MMQNMDRVNQAFDGFAALHKTYQLQMVLVEVLGGSQNSNVASTFGLVEGALACLANVYDLPVHAYYSEDIKKFATGKKNASKAEMIVAAEEMIPKLYKRCGFKINKKTGKWPGKVEHLADSVCVFEYAKRHSEIRALERVAASFESEGFQ